MQLATAARDYFHRNSTNIWIVFIFVVPQITIHFHTEKLVAKTFQNMSAYRPVATDVGSVVNPTL